MRTQQRIWRTATGRLVPESDTEAAFLAYAVGDELPDSIAEPGTPTVEAKQADRPADKSRRPAANKSRETGEA